MPYNLQWIHAVLIKMAFYETYLKTRMFLLTQRKEKRNLTHLFKLKWFSMAVLFKEWHSGVSFNETHQYWLEPKAEKFSRKPQPTLSWSSPALELCQSDQPIRRSFPPGGHS